MTRRHHPTTIKSIAPIRICDLGGWTDTWFAEYGNILNIAVAPAVFVNLAYTHSSSAASKIVLDVVNFGDRYSYNPQKEGWLYHPLLEAAIKSLMPPAGLALEIKIESKAPPGASTGTSAAVTVALTAALARLQEREMSKMEIAMHAHRVETEMLGLQSGIQDQLAAAFGGISYIEMDRFPHASVEQLALNPITQQKLESRLSLIYLGTSHNSSAVHQKVIAALEASGAATPALERLREMAKAGRAALEDDDIDRFAESMRANTSAQKCLNSALISQPAEKIISVAKRYPGTGWKVNGAGGEGGSLTILGGESELEREEMMAEILALDRSFVDMPIQLMPTGVSVHPSKQK